MARKRLGEILVECGLLEEKQLESALEQQSELGGRLGELLVREGFAHEDEIAECLAAQLDLPRIDLYESGVDAAAAGLLPVEMAERHGVIPVRFEGHAEERGAFVWVATADPTNLTALDEVQFRCGKRVRPVVVTWTQVHAAIRHAYYGEPLSPPSQGLPRQAGSTASGPLEPVSTEGDDEDGLPAIDVETEDEDEKDESDLDQQAEILAAIDAMAGGGGSHRDVQRFVSTSEIVSALVRLLIRKGVVDETELVEELQRK